MSNRAKETEGGGVNGSDRLKRKQTLGMDLQRICPSVNLTSISKTLVSSSQRGILLDLLPHTLSTDHAHNVFNSSILCKTG